MNIISVNATHIKVASFRQGRTQPDCRETSNVIDYGIFLSKDTAVAVAQE